jgi:hypothetical protein
MKKKRNYMESVRRRGGILRVEQHILAALECVQDPFFKKAETFAPKEEYNRKKEYIAAKYQSWPVKIKQRVLNLTFSEKKEKGFLEALLRLARAQTPEADEFVVAEGELIEDDGEEVETHGNEEE